MSSPDILIEVSWEVCNMVGGIHTVLATKVRAMQARYGTRYIVVGPDLARAEGTRPVFREEIWHAGLHEALADAPVGCRMGRWLVPGEPRCLLVDHNALLAHKDAILAQYWEWYRLDSIAGGWDYLEPVMFSHAVGQAVERLASAYFLPRQLAVVVQSHEWLTGATLLYLKRRVPEVGTVFTTHATTLGRALAANRPSPELYDTMGAVDPDATARELGVPSKHSMESIAAREADCFTTVSAITAEECLQFLRRAPDPILMNGMDDDFPPALLREPTAVHAARARLFEIATLATATTYDRDQTELFVCAGRYEFVNKGIDVALDALAALDHDLRTRSGGRVVVFALFPAGNAGPRRAILQASRTGERVEQPYLSTHDLHHEASDPILRRLADEGLLNRPENAVHVVFVPVYLDGNDPLVHETYYELVVGADLTLFPSFYEPWGYTPMESIALGVPTITTDLAGFGRWARDRGDWPATGVAVVARQGRAFEWVSQSLMEHLVAFLGLSPDERRALAAAALRTSHACRWKQFAPAYLEAHAQAAERAAERARTMPKGRFAALASLKARPVSTGSAVTARLHAFSVRNAVPASLAGLRELAMNLWWSWHPAAASLYAELDADLWSDTGRNPVQFLEHVESAKLAAAAASPAFVARVDQAVHDLADAMQRRARPEIAYFCMEYGLVDSFKLYSGGLGVLAGDHLKTASDLGLPMCAVGLAYRHGYFKQRLRPDGLQEPLKEHLVAQNHPLVLVTTDHGLPVTVELPLPGGTVYARAWRAAVGTVDLYLLDTNIEANRHEDRALTDSLYGGDQRHRLRQEMVLGMGGYRLLKAIGLTPQVYHMNEGHSAFLILARLVDLVQGGLKWHEALALVRQTTAFTTHTPVAAGHDAFPEDLIRPYIAPLEPVLLQDGATIAGLGQAPWAEHDPSFSMTALALRGSDRVNGVSRIHAAVSRRLFHPLYAGFYEDEVPVAAITNGVHVPTWLAPEWHALFDARLPDDWRAHLADEAYWDHVRQLDAREFWQARLSAKQRLLDWLRANVPRTWVSRREHPAALSESLRHLREDSLVIGFARRFAPYKRATLLFRDLERLESLVSGDVPIVFLFAGKAHPSDDLGKALIRDVVELARRPRLLGHVLFLEDYGMHLSGLMVAGCDVWLNTPTRPLEASGTSGIKAGVNGTLNLSVGDGWWPEAFNGRNGWMIDDVAAEEDPEYQNQIDSASVYGAIENEVLPRFTGRVSGGLPFEWVEMAKESMATILPRFSAERMLREYQARVYDPARRDAATLTADGHARLFALVGFKQRLHQHWDTVAFADLGIEGMDGDTVQSGAVVRLRVELRHPHLRAEELRVQAVVIRAGTDEQVDGFDTFDMAATDATGAGGPDAASVWAASITPTATGEHSLGVRVIPASHPAGADVETLTPLVKWL